MPRTATTLQSDDSDGLPIPGVRQFAPFCSLTISHVLWILAWILVGFSNIAAANPPHYSERLDHLLPLIAQESGGSGPADTQKSAEDPKDEGANSNEAADSSNAGSARGAETANSENGETDDQHANHGDGAEKHKSPPAWYLALAFVLLVANGFFVAAEFALVKVRISRVEQLIQSKRLFAKTARWLAERLEKTLSACQLGITMASLALGWVGEPAVAALLRPGLQFVGITSESVLSMISFIVGFTLITALHLVVGEQAPKIFAIRQPERMLLWCALPLKIYYLATYPLMVALNASTTWLLTLIGMKEADGHEVPYTEEEIRALLREAQIHGNLSRSEHRLLDAVFQFDDMVCRRIMLPRGEVEFVDINLPVDETLAMIRRTKHTRYPICDGSLDEVQGVLHVKDLIGRKMDGDFSFKDIMRPPKKVPENMPISKLLRHFQGTHQLLAFVLDEYGTVIGIVTLENVLEEIIGDVVDEFDDEDPEIVPDGPGAYLVAGSTAVHDVEEKLGLLFAEEADVDTMAGLVMHYAQRIVTAGDEVDLIGARARVLEVVDDRTTQLRITLSEEED